MARLKMRVDRLWQAQERDRLEAARRLLITSSWCDPADSMCLVMAWGGNAPEGWTVPDDAETRQNRAWQAMLQHATPTERLLLDLPEVTASEVT